MEARGRDPYTVLGVKPGASDAEVRAAHRRLVQLHHPDHNAGSAESARRFEEVQEAYAQIRKLRGDDGARDPSVDARLAELERELRVAQAARERARAAAREAARQAAAAGTPNADAPGRSSAQAKRASDEQLGYITTDDSLSKILADARTELSDLYAEARQQPLVRHVGELIDELASRLKGDG
jgi:curved DNA-binding protein CbpA